VALDLEKLRKPSPPAISDASESSGSYWPVLFRISGAATPGTLRPGLLTCALCCRTSRIFETLVKEDDRHRYIMIDYQNGVSVPSWMVSDGTLRLLALTMLAYAPEFRGVLPGRGA